MATEATTGYMNIDQAAADLETNPLAVKRLIARGRVTAVQLGVGGKWRIAGSELARYIGAGAADLKMPHIVSDWFDLDDTYSAAADFLDSFIKAAGWGLGDAPPAGDGPFEATITPAMRAAMTAAPRRRVTYVDAFHAWAVERTRQIMKGLVGRNMPKALDTLYDSPLAYTDFTTEAILALLKSKIGFSYIFPDHRSARFFVPVSNMLDTARRAQILQAAF